MTITNKQSGTNVHEIAERIYRINTPVVIEGTGDFSFNQYLVVDDEPLLFHTGPRRMFPLVREAQAKGLVTRLAPDAATRPSCFAPLRMRSPGNPEDARPGPAAGEQPNAARRRVTRLR